MASIMLPMEPRISQCNLEIIEISYYLHFLLTQTKFREKVDLNLNWRDQKIQSIFQASNNSNLNLRVSLNNRRMP